MPQSSEHLHSGSESARSGDRTGQRPPAPEFRKDRDSEYHTGTYVGHDELNIYLSPLSGTGADSTDVRTFPRKDLMGRDSALIKRDFDPTNLIGRKVTLERGMNNEGTKDSVPVMQNRRLRVVNDDGTPDMKFYGEKDERIGRRAPYGSLMSD